MGPDDENFIDTTQGGFYWDLTQAVALEIERLWDYLSTEVPAAAFVAFAWGEYLDEHGVVLNLERKAATLATGEVTFTGTNGTAVPTGTQVAASLEDPDAETEPTFQTTESGIVAGGEVTLAVESIIGGSGSNVAMNEVALLLSPIAGITAVGNDAAISGGFDVESDEAYRNRLVRKAAAPTGQGNVAAYEEWALAYPGVGYVTVNANWAGAGSVQVIVTDYDNNPVTVAVEDGLQDELDPLSVETTLTANYTSGSATMNVTSTTGFRAATAGSPQRVNLNDTIITYTGSTGTTFTGCTGGSAPGSNNGATVAQGGAGAGKAPVGADVTVDTPAAVLVDAATTLITEPGYSASGAGGTIALDVAVEEAIRAYIDSLAPGQTVRINRVEAVVLGVRGVLDISAVTLNGGGTNVAMDSDPPEVAVADAITVT